MPNSVRWNMTDQLRNEIRERGLSLQPRKPPTSCEVLAAMSIVCFFVADYMVRLFFSYV